MSVGDVYEGPVLNAILGSLHTSEFPDTVHIALYRDDDPPDDSGGGTEITDLGRVAIPNDDTHWPDASGSQKSNGLDITGFNTVSSDQPAAGWWALLDAPSGGNVVLWAQLADVYTVYAGESGFIPAGTLVVTAD